MQYTITYFNSDRKLTAILFVPAGERVHFPFRNIILLCTKHLDYFRSRFLGGFAGR